MNRTPNWRERGTTSVSCQTCSLTHGSPTTEIVISWPHICFLFTSSIRESMVKIMLTSDPRQVLRFGDDRDEISQLDAVPVGVDVLSALNGKSLPMDPSTCVFWCAVALGALVRGSPFKTVSGVCLLSVQTSTWVERKGYPSRGAMSFVARCAHGTRGYFYSPKW